MPMKENTKILQYVPTIFTGESTEGTNYVHIYYYKCSFFVYAYIHVYTLYMYMYLFQ